MHLKLRMQSREWCIQSIESMNCERPHTVLQGWIQDFQIGVQKIMHTLRTSQVRNTKSCMARSRVLDVFNAIWALFWSILIQNGIQTKKVDQSSILFFIIIIIFFFFFFFFGGGGGAWIRHWYLQVY